jgi:protein-disulfide isomerase
MARPKYEAQQPILTASGAPFGASRPRDLVALTALPALTALLALFQWMELVVVRAGGDVSCSISEKLDCASVWSAPLAKAVHALTRVPVAGWGLVWALGALGAGLWAVSAGLGQRSVDRAVATARVFAGAGVIAAIGLFAVSLSLGVYCPTCIVTYALVAAYAFFAMRAQAGRASGFAGLRQGLVPAGSLVVSGYLLALYPGSRTALEPKVDLGVARPQDGEASAERPPVLLADSSPLSSFLAQLPPEAQQAVSSSLDFMRHSPVVEPGRFPPRALQGPASAPLRIVDFSDMLCGHCRHLHLTMEELEKTAPAGSFSRESRYFPLDSACNPKLPPKMTDGKGTRCVAAKALICSEKHPKLFELRHKLFEAQSELDVDKVYELARQVTGAERAALERCVEAEETKATLLADIEYAEIFQPKGTPLVLINGRNGTPIGPFLYAMILAQGDMQHAAFAMLPPPKGLHDGHGH